MKYPDGKLAHLGDRIHLWDGADGVIVCSIDTGEYSDNFTEEEWGYLQQGILVQSSQVGLIHYIEPEATFRLISRSKTGG